MRKIQIKKYVKIPLCICLLQLAAYGSQVYNGRMKILTIFCILFCLTACGPKEIGQGLAEETGDADSGPSTAELMRYPMTGSSYTQQMLYHRNRPAIMEQVRQWRMRQFDAYMGLKPSPENPAYRETPKERSPFRQ